MKNIFIVLVCLFVSFQTSAQVRQKDSHEHGAANLMLAIEGDKLQIGIEVPSESLIGFEHFPKSRSDRENFNEAIKILSDPSKFFSTLDDAECLLTGLNVSQTLFSGEEEDEHGHEEKDEHDEHGHEEEDEHGHEKKDEHCIRSVASGLTPENNRLTFMLINSPVGKNIMCKSCSNLDTMSLKNSIGMHQFSKVSSPQAFLKSLLMSKLKSSRMFF